MRLEEKYWYIETYFLVGTSASRSQEVVTNALGVMNR